MVDLGGEATIRATWLLGLTIKLLANIDIVEARSHIVHKVATLASIEIIFVCLRGSELRGARKGTSSTSHSHTLR